MKEGLTFDDVLIRPNFSDIRSRSEINLSVSLPKRLNYKIPIIPANMLTVINEKVAEEFYKLGGLSLLHRFEPIENQIKKINNLKLKYTDIFDYVGISVGIKSEDYENIKTFYDLGVRIICIDIAHGDSVNCVDMVKFISSKYPDVFLIAGNVATGSGAFRLWLEGADACKVGVGAGSICSTRIATGCGVPQLAAIMDVYETRLNNPIMKNKIIISDGGCSKVGDIVKSLCFSDLVMCGNMFAGSTDGPGEEFELNGKKYKNYDGSSTHKSDFIEGVKSLVEVKPEIKTIVKKMLEGLASGCSYVGAHNLNELKENTEFIKITRAGFIESGSHDVVVKS